MDVLYIFFWLILSTLLALFAASQNRSGIGWFFASLIISPIISLIILLAVGKIEPVDNSSDSIQPTSNRSNISSKPDPIPETKNCPYCAETIKKAAIVCRFCGHSLSASPLSENESLKIVKGSPEEKLVEGVITNNWGKVNSAIMLGANLSVKKDEMTIYELAENHSDESIQTLLKKHKPEISEFPQREEQPKAKKIPFELKNTSEGKLVEGILTSNWGKVNSALMLGADISITFENKTMADLAREYKDPSIIALIEKQLCS
tara:strand:- start:75 stop:860 length:786 start_codon:yes stop_codon:yes gene_type:complete